MKNFLKMFGAVGLLAGMLMAGGCGDDNVTPSGRVVKGPVSGAVVTDSKGVVISTQTNSGGYFTVGGTAPYTTNGGTYFPLTASGTYSAVAVNAPPMSAPAGATQITPLSTLFTTLTAAQQAALLTKLGLGSLNDDLAVKSAANTKAFTLSETVGAVLTQAVTNGASLAQINTIASSMATAINTSLTAAATVDTAAITAAVTAGIAAIPAATVPAAITGTLAAAATTATTGAGVLVAGTVPAAPALSTGSTGSTGTIVK